MVAFVAGRDSPPDAGLRGDFEEDITAYFQAARGRDLARDARVLYELAFARDEVTARYRELVAAIAESKENHDLFYKESKARTKWSDASIDDDHIQIPVEVQVSGGQGGDYMVTYTVTAHMTHERGRWRFASLDLVSNIRP